MKAHTFYVISAPSINIYSLHNSKTLPFISAISAFSAVNTQKIRC